MPMQLKLNDQGFAVVQDGKPVYILEDKTEQAFDVPGTVATISRLNSEAKTHREAKEAAETKLKTFDGIDVEKARKALDTVANLDAKKLIDTGEAERVRNEAIKATEEKYKPYVEKSEKLESKIATMAVNQRFLDSKFIKEKTVMPPGMLQDTFAKHFKFEDEQVIPYDANGHKIMSKENPANVASFDEALGLLISASQYKDNILKGTGSSGTGSQQGTGGPGTGGSKTMLRSEFDKIDPIARGKVFADGITVVDG